MLKWDRITLLHKFLYPFVLFIGSISPVDKISFFGVGVNPCSFMDYPY